MKVSIITINFNNALGLKKTIESVIFQTYNNIEYIVIDGGSTDNSKDIILEYQDNISYWVSETDKGIYNAMNKGILKATGDYLLFLNSGDLLLDNDVINKLIKLNCIEDLLIGNIVLNSNNKRREWIIEDNITFYTFYYSGIPHPSTFIRRNLFKEVGLYDENLKIISDWKFFLLALCRYNCSYRRIPILISEFFEDGISTNFKYKNLVTQERIDVLEANFPRFLDDYKELQKSKTMLYKLRFIIILREFFSFKWIIKRDDMLFK